MPEPPERRLAPVPEAATYANLHPATIWRYINSGRLTKYRLGVKFVRVDLDEVDALLAPIIEKAS